MAQQEVAGFSSQRPDFNPSPVHVRFVVKKVALEQVFLVVLRFLYLHRCCMLIHHRRYII